jgi:hypothetical protein
MTCLENIAITHISYITIDKPFMDIKKEGFNGAHIKPKLNGI